MAIFIRGPFDAQLSLPDKMLRHLPAPDEGQTGGTVAYRYRFVPSVGVKNWVYPDDLAINYVQRPVGATVSSGTWAGYYEYDISTWPELAGFQGFYDVAVTSVDAAGNESTFLATEDAYLEF